AAGIHPALLTEQGLGPALASLAARSHVPVRLVIPPQRLPGVIETAVYFVCSEGLANVAKHAQATRADIRVGLERDLVTVRIPDDGTGGADPSAGSGLKGSRTGSRRSAAGSWCTARLRAARSCWCRSRPHPPVQGPEAPGLWLRGLRAMPCSGAARTPGSHGPPRWAPGCSRSSQPF